MSVAIGIDVGGTKIAGGVVDDSGVVVARRQIPTDSSGPPAIVAGIAKVALEMRAAAPAAVAVGVGAAGLVDHKRGVVLSAPNLAWRNVHLAGMLEDRLGMPVAVENDANAAAWGEALYGAGRGAGDQVMVTVGTGVGGGIVLNGALYRGAHGMGAEIGHMVVDSGGPLCGCGSAGCLEAMASGLAIGRRAAELVVADAGRGRGLVERAGGEAAEITGEMVGSAAAAGDELASAVLREAGEWLGVGIGSLVNLLDPAVIVVGGGVAAGNGDLLLEPARRRMGDLLIGREWRSPPPVVPAALGPDAGIVGAAALARAAAR